MATIPNRNNNTGSATKGRPGPKNKKLPEKPNSGPAKTKEKGQGSGGNAQKTARRLTNMAIKDEVKDLRSQRREVSRTARHAKKEVRNQYQRGMGDLEAVHGTTAGYINAQNAQAQAGFNAASVEQQAAAAALQNQLSNVYDAGEGSATAEMARLGITGGSGFLGQLTSDQAWAGQMGAQTSANNAANLGLAQANAGSVGSLLASMNQGSLLSGMGKNLNQRNDSMNEIRGEEMDQKQLVREAIRDAKGSRKDTMFQLLTQLRQSGWGRR
jgi:hypothetical protein